MPPTPPGSPGDPLSPPHHYDSLDLEGSMDPTRGAYTDRASTGTTKRRADYGVMESPSVLGGDRGDGNTSPVAPTEDYPWRNSQRHQHRHRHGDQEDSSAHASPSTSSTAPGVGIGPSTVTARPSARKGHRLARMHRELRKEADALLRAENDLRQKIEALESGYPTPQSPNRDELPSPLPNQILDRQRGWTGSRLNPNRAKVAPLVQPYRTKELTSPVLSGRTSPVHRRRNVSPGLEAPTSRAPSPRPKTEGKGGSEKEGVRGVRVGGAGVDEGAGRGSGSGTRPHRRQRSGRVAPEEDHDDEDHASPSSPVLSVSSHPLPDVSTSASDPSSLASVDAGEPPLTFRSSLLASPSPRLLQKDTTRHTWERITAAHLPPHHRGRPQTQRTAGVSIEVDAKSHRSLPPSGDFAARLKEVADASETSSSATPTSSSTSSHVRSSRAPSPEAGPVPPTPRLLPSTGQGGPSTAQSSPVLLEYDGTSASGGISGGIPDTLGFGTLAEDAVTRTQLVNIVHRVRSRMGIVRKKEHELEFREAELVAAEEHARRASRTGSHGRNTPTGGTGRLTSSPTNHTRTRPPSSSPGLISSSGSQESGKTGNRDNCGSTATTASSDLSLAGAELEEFAASLQHLAEELRGRAVELDHRTQILESREHEAEWRLHEAATREKAMTVRLDLLDKKPSTENRTKVKLSRMYDHQIQQGLSLERRLRKIEAQEQHVVELHRNAESRHAEAKRLLLENKEEHEALNLRTQDLASQATKLAQREAELAAKSSQVETERTALAHQKDQYQAILADVEVRETYVGELQLTLERLQVVLGEREADLEARAETIKSRELDVAHDRAQTGPMLASIADRDRVVMLLERELLAKKENLRRREEELAILAQRESSRLQSPPRTRVPDLRDATTQATPPDPTPFQLGLSVLEQSALDLSRTRNHVVSSILPDVNDDLAFRAVAVGSTFATTPQLRTDHYSTSTNTASVASAPMLHRATDEEAGQMDITTTTTMAADDRQGSPQIRDGDHHLPVGVPRRPPQPMHTETMSDMDPRSPRSQVPSVTHSPTSITRRQIAYGSRVDGGTVEILSTLPRPPTTSTATSPGFSHPDNAAARYLARVSGSPQPSPTRNNTATTTGTSPIRTAHHHASTQFDIITTREREMANILEQLREKDFNLNEREATVSVKEADLLGWEKKLQRIEDKFVERQKAIRIEVEKLKLREIEIETRVHELERQRVALAEAAKDAALTQDHASTNLASAQARLAEAEEKLANIMQRESACQKLEALVRKEKAAARDQLREAQKRETASLEIAAKLETEAKGLSTKKNELTKLERDLRLREERTNTMRTDMERGEKKLKADSAKVTSEKEALASQVQEVNTRLASVTQREATVAATLSSTESREAVIREKQAQLGAVEGRVTVLERELLRRERDVVALENDLMTREEKVTARERAVDEHHAEVTAREKALSSTANMRMSTEFTLRDSLAKVLGQSEASWIQATLSAHGLDSVAFLREIREYKEKARAAEKLASTVLADAKKVQAKADARTRQIASRQAELAAERQAMSIEATRLELMKAEMETRTRHLESSANLVHDARRALADRERQAEKRESESMRLLHSLTARTEAATAEWQRLSIAGASGRGGREGGGGVVIHFARTLGSTTRDQGRARLPRRCRYEGRWRGIVSTTQHWRWT